MNNRKGLRVEQLDTYGISKNFMLSTVKIGNTTFTVSSYFKNNRTFTETMCKVIEKRIKAS